MIYPPIFTSSSLGVNTISSLRTNLQAVYLPDFDLSVGKEAELNN